MIKIILCYTESLRPAWYMWDPCFKNKIKQQQEQQYPNLKLDWRAGSSFKRTCCSSFPAPIVGGSQLTIAPSVAITLFLPPVHVGTSPPLPHHVHPITPHTPHKRIKNKAFKNPHNN